MPGEIPEHASNSSVNGCESAASATAGRWAFIVLIIYFVARHRHEETHILQRKSFG